MKRLLTRLKVLIFGKTSKSAILRCIIFAIGFWYIFDYMFDTYTVDGPSMDTTLKQGQIVWINKYHYNFFDPRRYDIVVMRDLEDGGHMIKRIIGLPGEEIEMIEGIVFINGFPDLDAYEVIQSEANRYPGMIFYDNFGPYVLRPDQYFYHGDNRIESIFGTIYIENILGKVVIPSKEDTSRH